jgi:uncharacterized protein YndB with AHSA1/START domain
MSKFKYVTESEFSASAQRIFRYLSTPEGLSRWFAEKVRPMSDKQWDMVWDETSHLAKIVAFKENAYVKYQFLPENEHDKKDLAFIDFRLKKNDITDTIFLSVTDYSEMTSLKELDDLWQTLIYGLKKQLEEQV